MAYADDGCPDCAKEATQQQILDKLKEKPPDVEDHSPDGLYKKNDELTYSKVFGQFSQRLGAAPILNAIGSYLSYGAAASTCPTFAVNAWVFYLYMDQFCSELMMSMWPMIRLLVLFLFGWISFRWALL